MVIQLVSLPMFEEKFGLYPIGLTTLSFGNEATPLKRYNAPIKNSIIGHSLHYLFE